MFMYYWILNRFADDFCNNCVWRHYVNICSFNKIDVHENEFESSFWQYTTFFTSERRISSRNNFKTFVNVFDYLLMRCTEFKFTAVLLTMFMFNIISSTSVIKQDDVLFVFFDNVKNAQEEKNIFYNVIESLVQNVIAVLNNMKLINVDDSENTFAISNFKIFSILSSVRSTISNSIFDFFFVLNRLYAYRYIQWKDSRKEYFDVEWENLCQ